MTRKEIRKHLTKFLDWQRNFVNYDKCSDPFTDKKMKNIQLKTTEVGYQYHNQDVSALYEHTLRTLWCKNNRRNSKANLQRIEDILSVATEMFFEMSETDIPNWHMSRSLIESLTDVKEHMIKDITNYKGIWREVA